ncbi:sorbosone dehydrogenase family protein [Pelomonas sp. KK5]|uniref:PQQ-dependent sugar dehydrogenase n=1 Tax=Pelomonas sp. KK5 TaxID=1855730 RepID=UPI00097C4DD8|nr:PQQ-dependent sugar dehydrogenase [Pelomonas sp. KK5]
MRAAAASLLLLAIATAARADVASEVLPHIKLPPGFRIELYAMVPDARHMAVGKDMVFVGTRKADAVWTLARGADGRVAAQRFAPDVAFKMPNGVCLDRDGSLIVAELNRVLRFAPGSAVPTQVVAQGRLIPPVEESGNHGARVCRVGPDGRLYIALGQPYNVPPREKLALYKQWGIGGIVRMGAADGAGREVYADGIRNSVGIEFNPKDGSLWFTDNQTDGMGEDIPEGSINRATRAGQFFGYPWVEGKVRITEQGYDKDPLPPNITEAQVRTTAHAADLGLAFYTGSMFPAHYRGGLFSAQHGSWNRRQPVGARVMFTALKPDGTADHTEVFAEGWLDDKGDYRGRPVDVAPLPDGSLLVSDDRAGAIYRISYTAPR